jgi:hypothetical protein
MCNALAAYNEKMIRPRTDLCATPQVINDGVEEVPASNALESIAEIGLEPSQPYAAQTE